ncbi:hypothetical protein YC2023_089747 [Brassica napus]
MESHNHLFGSVGKDKVLSPPMHAEFSSLLWAMEHSLHLGILSMNFELDCLHMVNSKIICYLKCKHGDGVAVSEILSLLSTIITNDRTTVTEQFCFVSYSSKSCKNQSTCLTFFYVVTT